MHGECLFNYLLYTLIILPLSFIIILFFLLNAEVFEDYRIQRPCNPLELFLTGL